MGSPGVRPASAENTRAHRAKRVVPLPCISQNIALALVCGRGWAAPSLMSLTTVYPAT
jgi:hypothetical protein